MECTLPSWRPCQPLEGDLVGPALDVPVPSEMEPQVPPPEREARAGRVRSTASARPTTQKRHTTDVPDECN